METLLVKKKCQLDGHRDTLYALSPAMENGNIYSAGSDKLIVEWNIDSATSIKVVANVPDTIYALCLIEAASILLIGNKAGDLYVVDLLNSIALKNLSYHKQPIFDLQYSKKHQCILAAGGDGKVSIWDAASYALISTLQHSEAAARTIAVHPDENSFAIGYSDNSIRIFQLPDFKLTQIITGHTSSVFSLQYSPDGRHLISGSRDAHLKIWAVEEAYTLLRDIVAHLFTINTIAYHPSGTFFATGSRDKTLKIWDADTFKLVKVLNNARDGGHSNSVNKIIWTADGNLVSCGDDRKVLVWETATSLD
jgi:WD40 repeat protein